MSTERDEAAREYEKAQRDYHDSDGVDVREVFKAGWDARDAEIESLRAQFKDAENERIEWVKRGERAEQLCDELRAESVELKARVEKLEAVARAAMGFRDHGVAKDGTHGSLLFKALADLDGGRVG